MQLVGVMGGRHGRYRLSHFSFFSSCMCLFVFGGRRWIVICMIVSSFSSSQHNLLLLILFSLSFHAYVCLRLHPPLVVQKSPMCHLAINETFIQSMLILKLSHNTKGNQNCQSLANVRPFPSGIQLWRLKSRVFVFLVCLFQSVSTSIYSVLSLLALACR